MVNNKWIFEVGGKSKTGSQIKDMEYVWLVKDEIEYAFGREIPLWMFGLMY